MRPRNCIALLALAAIILSVVGCSRNPEVVKRRYLENGNKYLNQGKVKEAILMYRNAIKKDPKFGEAYEKLGDAEVRRGGLREAVSAYRRAVELLPKHDDVAGKLADIYLMAYSASPKKDPRLLSEVEDLKKSLLAKNQSSFQGLRLQGFLYVANEDYPHAIESFKRADSVHPGDPQLRFALCQVLNQSGSWTEAESYAKQIMKDSPSFVFSYDFLSLQYLRRNQIADAEAVVLAKAAKNPQQYVFEIQKAGFYRATHRNEIADKVLSDLLKRQPQSADVWQRVGDFYVRIREFNRANQIYDEGMQKFTDKRTSFQLRKVTLLVLQSKSREALDLIEKTVKDDSKSDEALAMRAALQLSQGGKDKAQAAINDLQSLLSRAPKNAAVRYNLGRAYFTRGELDAARVQFTEAVKLSPSMTAARLGLGQIALMKRDLGKAINEVDEVLKYDPRNLQARVIKANALTGSGNLRQARFELSNYLKDAPNSDDLKFQLAIVDFMDGQYKQAEAGFRDLRSRHPQDVRLAYAITEIMLRTNRQSDGLRFMQEELKRSPSDNDLRQAVAVTALKVDQLDVAERELKSLINANTQSSEVYLAYGTALSRMGRAPAALDALRKAQSLAPNSPRVNLQLAVALDNAGRKSESVPFYQSVLKYDSENAVALNNLAFSLAEDERDLDQALTYAQRAKQRAPGEDDVSDTLAWVYTRKRLNDNAISILKELTVKKPKNSLYHYHLGVALAQKGNRTAARQSLQTALGLASSQSDAAKIRQYLAKIG